MVEYPMETFRGEDQVDQAIEFLRNQSTRIIKVMITHDGTREGKRAPSPPPPVSSGYPDAQ